ncbi:hypothetical protein AVEN_19012-1 [Araneus ventricosus]|uniref:Uncharacterized protein n=1 Tax=Araneus ventricosus TaxID=182803 RepID=A0A4Y2KLG0_ARAVE|nr:hypothetical protein AVEN_19012-1 [Araneus ventricosus]
MKRSLLNHCDVPSKHQKGVRFETFDFCEWDIAASQPASPTSEPASQPATPSTHRSPPPATPTSLMPDGYIHLGDDMMLDVAEFLGCLKVHLRHYVVKNNHYIPIRTGIAISPNHWQVLSDSISTLILESPHACLMIELKLFFSVTGTSVSFNICSTTTQKRVCS